MASKSKRRFPDVHRLLSARDNFRELQGEGASSVPAFLAWKAFLVVARLECGTSEKHKVIASCRESITRFGPDLEESVKRFSVALSSVNNVPDSVVRDWYVSAEMYEQVSKSYIADEVAQARRRIARMQRAIDRATSCSVFPCEEIGLELYRIRNVVLAHPRVLTGANLFETIVPAFEDLVYRLALAGWGRHTNTSYLDAEAILEQQNG